MKITYLHVTNPKRFLSRHALKLSWKGAEHLDFSRDARQLFKRTTYNFTDPDIIEMFTLLIDYPDLTTRLDIADKLSLPDSLVERLCALQVVQVDNRLANRNPLATSIQEVLLDRYLNSTDSVRTQVMHNLTSNAGLDIQLLPTLMNAPGTHYQLASNPVVPPMYLTKIADTIQNGNEERYTLSRLLSNSKLPTQDWVRLLRMVLFTSSSYDLGGWISKRAAVGDIEVVAKELIIKETLNENTEAGTKSNPVTEKEKESNN